MTTFAELGGVLKPLGRYAIEGETRWSLFAPSIGWSPEEGYRVVYRSSNHYLLTDGSVRLTYGEFQLTRTYTQKLSDNLEKLEEPVKLPASSYRARAGEVAIKKGVEDIRLFCRPEGWHLIGALVDKDPVVLVAILFPGQEPLWVAVEGIKGAPDRDWIPAAYGGSEGFDYILPRGKVVRQKKVVRAGSEVEELRHFFGGPPVVPLGDGTFLGAPHMAEVVGVRVYTPSRMAYINGTNLHYTHRFVRYSEDGAVVEMSDPWTFESGSFEKCAGMVHWGDDFALTYGRNEVSSVLGRISQRKTLKLLKKV